MNSAVVRGLIVCGVDEAGRGPLAGPVFAAAVVLRDDDSIRGLADSKKLSPMRREELAAQIHRRSAAWAIASASVEEIELHNILRASLLAMQRAVELLAIEPHHVLVDGMYCPQVRYPVRAVVRGDDKIPAISAASILAKTARDAVMLELHARFPEYGFDRNKGYPTPDHLAALRRFGVSPAHRRSFAPVRALCMDLGDQTSQPQRRGAENAEKI